MTLQERLDAIRIGSEPKYTEMGILGTMQGHTRFLTESGQAGRAIGEGDTAPDFRLEGPGGDVSLADLRAKGPVILTWFRGTW